MTVVILTGYIRDPQITIQDSSMPDTFVPDDAMPDGVKTLADLNLHLGLRGD